MFARMLGCVRAGRRSKSLTSLGSRSRLFSSTRPVDNYDATLKNLKIGRHTRVMFQGFTGKQATADANESIAWGTNIVGGVTPGREGQHLGLPLLPSVRKAVDLLAPDATGIYVAGGVAMSAIEESIEAQVPLIVAVAEHIPLHDLLRIHSILQTQSASRLVGANSPGIISSVGKCRIGFQPLPCFEPGRIGIVARSGTLSYEAAASTLRAGLGQSMCIGVGGDILPGTSLTDGLKLLAEDPDTEGIALVGEVGGNAEIEAADWIQKYRAVAKNAKPIVALVAGVNAVPGRIMGHAGAFTLPAEAPASAKIEALRGAGATIVNHPSRLGPVLKSLLASSRPASIGTASTGSVTQRRGLHEAARRPAALTAARAAVPTVQKRTLYLDGTAALDLLRKWNITTSDQPAPGTTESVLAVTINRTSRRPCILVSPTSGTTHRSTFDFDYRKGVADLDMPAIATALRLGPSPSSSLTSLQTLLSQLVSLFTAKEAFLLSTNISQQQDSSGVLAVRAALLGFDNAAFRSCQRNSDIHALRASSLEDATEVEAERDGIIYIKLPRRRDDHDGANLIGTLANGAGLAMNTVDALTDAGGRPANFLDTGGKATSETVKKSFELILTDPRVKCILVNIFGGLTLGDVIARGVVLAFNDLHVHLPVVVRIRGSNEREGRQIIADSGLPLFAFDDFDDAAAKAIELAGQPSSRLVPC